MSEITAPESDTAWTPRRIDFHQHFFPDIGAEAAKYMTTVAADTGWIFPSENFPLSPGKSLEFMDGLGISTAIVSLTGSPVGDGVGTANREFARILNLAASQMVTEHPGRFGFFANIPIPSDTDAPLKELA